VLRVCHELASTVQNVSRVFYCYLRKLQICHCVQLNALFCCHWRNVEAFCHKHFVVFSHNQHRRLLQAMCHNLRHTGRAPPATALTTLAVAALTQAVKQDISSESQFLPTTHAFGVPIRGGGSCRNIAMPFGTKKLAWCGYAMVKKV